MVWLVVFGLVVLRAVALGLFVIVLVVIGLVALGLFVVGFDTNGLDGLEFVFLSALRDLLDFFSSKSCIELDGLKWKRRTSSMRENSLMLPFSTRT